MQTIKANILVILLILVFSGYVHSQGYEFDQGLTTAKSQNKMILIYIYTEGDRWCDKMVSEVYSKPEVQKALNDFIFIKLNAGSANNYTYNNEKLSATNLSKKLGVMSYPTHVFMNPDGSQISFNYNGMSVNNIPGFLDEEDFSAMLNYMKTGKYKSEDLSKYF
ncbi:MAG: DUF255 domain-containing protein [Ignavibacteriaceae bacterium]|nr:DUF255 domain-containing protein [Ignavibacteriales bacterium]MEB2330049.1 DUF255 domain-containing protein [Ignavibacteriaceae bacterium]